MSSVPLNDSVPAPEPDPDPTGNATPAGLPEPLPPGPTVLNRLLHGTFWLALKTPAAILTNLWAIPLTQRYLGAEQNGDYLFAWDFGLIQMVLEFGMGSTLQKQMTDAWARDDRAAVNRTIACGMTFYAAIGLIQMVVLATIATRGLPDRFQGNSLVLGLFWLQILTTPFYGLSAVVGSVLQAARRYDFIPRLELLIILLRFGVLLLGYSGSVPYLWVVVGQVAVQVGLSLGPALVVMVRELGYWPHFGGARRADYAALLQVSLYMALNQWAVVLADKVDVILLGYALSGPDVGLSITIYQNVSKPFFQIRQASWALVYLVMPAVVALSVAGDRRALEQVKYDGTRYMVALLLPVTLLAGIFAAPFLDLWVGQADGHRFANDAWMLRLFLVAAAPLLFQVIGQMAVALGHLRFPALVSITGAVVNLGLSYALTRRAGVSGVIWGTVLTTLIANFVIPGTYFMRVMAIDPRAFLTRALGPPLVGGLVLLATCGLARLALPLSGTTAEPARLTPFLLELAGGCLAYLVGYLSLPRGRSDLAALVGKLTRRGRS